MPAAINNARVWWSPGMHSHDHLSNNLMFSHHWESSCRSVLLANCFSLQWPVETALPTLPIWLFVSTIIYIYIYMYRQLIYGLLTTNKKQSFKFEMLSYLQLQLHVVQFSSKSTIFLVTDQYRSVSSTTKTVFLYLLHKYKTWKWIKSPVNSIWCRAFNSHMFWFFFALFTQHQTRLSTDMHIDLCSKIEQISL